MLTGRQSLKESKTNDVTNRVGVVFWQVFQINDVKAYYTVCFNQLYLIYMTYLTVRFSFLFLHTLRLVQIIYGTAAQLHESNVLKYCVC